MKIPNDLDKDPNFKLEKRKKLKPQDWLILSLILSIIIAGACATLLMK